MCLSSIALRCLVRYYIKLEKIDEGENCLKEVSSLSPLSHQMFYMRGLIHHARNQFKLAKQNYNDALAIHPYHFPTLIQLTKLLIQIGNYSLAEKYARDAIAIQPANYQPWSLHPPLRLAKFTFSSLSGIS